LLRGSQRSGRVIRRSGLLGGGGEWGQLGASEALQEIILAVRVLHHIGNDVRLLRK
jgi:hypothetical protein